MVGSTCMENNVILIDISLSKMEDGDFIQFNGVSAYTICLTPTFINFLEPILIQIDITFVKTRRCQTVEDIVGIYNF